MTLTQLLADLKNIIGPSVEVDDPGLKRWINEAYQFLIDDIQKAAPDYFAKSSTTTLYSGQQEYTMPSDLDKVIAVNVKYSSGVWTKALPMPNINMIPVINSSSTTQGFSEAQPGYYLFDNELGLMPIPTADSDSGLKVYYTYTPAEMTSDSESPQIPSRYHHILKYSAYANYLDQDDEHVGAERMRQRFDLLAFRMVEQMSDRQVDEPKSVLITQNQDMYTGDAEI